MVSVQVPSSRRICKAHELLAPVAERGELGPSQPGTPVDLEPGKDRIGLIGSGPGEPPSRRPVVSQPAAGADPDAAVRIGPERIPVAYRSRSVRLPCSNTSRSRRRRTDDSVGAAPPEAPPRVKAVKGGDLDRFGIGSRGPAWSARCGRRRTPPFQFRHRSGGAARARRPAPTSRCTGCR